MKLFPVSELYLQENFHLFENLGIKTFFFFLHHCFVYERFLNLRGAGWGVPLVPFGWGHPEVTQTPGGPLRPGWPLSPGLPTWPLSPGFPGWPSNALPGRPGKPVGETWNVLLTAGKAILLLPTYHLVLGLQRNQESHIPWSLYHLVLLAHLQIKHSESLIWFNSHKTKSCVVGNNKKKNSFYRLK